VTAFEVLGLGPDATETQVKEAWRVLAGKHHPDKGGDAAEFHKYRLAYNQALKDVATPKPCMTCWGKKRVQRASGFNTLMVRCPDCNGTGVRSRP
jgi:DnaJ-class molecular chaperone